MEPTTTIEYYRGTLRQVNLDNVFAGHGRLGAELLPAY